MRKEVWMTAKKVWIVFAKVFATAVMLLALIAGIQASDIDLNDCNRYTGRLEEIGTISKKGKTWLFIRLKGLNITLLSYNISQGYSSITSLIQEGEIVTVYYPKSPFSQLEVYQIERDGRIILNKSSFERKWIFVSTICILGLIWIWFEKHLKRWAWNKIRSYKAAKAHI